MISTPAIVFWVSPIVMLAATAWPLRIEAQESGSQSGSQGMQVDEVMRQHMLSPGIVMPGMDAANGRKLFASKGCVVCHAVNGIGGTDAVPLDATTMSEMTNPFEFVANMWRGAQPMIEMQAEELGGQVEFTGQELADIIAFLHHPAEQKIFSQSDIPPEIQAVIAKMERGGVEDGNENGMNNMKMKPDAGDSGN